MTDMNAGEILALARDNDGWEGGNSWLLVVIILFAMMGGNWGGWGNNGFANAIGYENLATSNEVQRGFDNQNSMANQREILAAVNNGTAQAVATTNQTFHDTLAALSDKYMELQRDIAGLAVGQANQLAQQNQCCCETKMLIQETAANQRYESAMQHAETLQAIQAADYNNREMQQQNKIEALQGQVQQLQLAQAMNGVVRYPDSFAYNAGNNPFCNCGNYNGCCGNI